MHKIKWIVLGAVLLGVLAVVGFFSMTTVPAGHTGVVSTFGRVEDYVLDEGFHMKSPVQVVINMDNRTQEKTMLLQAFSSDIQQVDVECSINYSVDRATCQNLYKNIGKDYYSIVMEPRIMENLKGVFTKYSAETLVSVREELSVRVKDLLVEEMKPYGIHVINISIKNIDFTDAFTDAVEAKQVAEQTKLKAETEQKQLVMEKEAEAERKIITANAEAKEKEILANANAQAQKIQADADAYSQRVKADAEAEANKKISESLTDSLLQYEEIQQWDGKLPIVTSDSSILPIMDLKDLQSGR